jgi:hypothetical protein
MPFQNCPFDQTPLSQSQQIVTPKINNLNYTNQDFWSLKTRLVQYIQEQFATSFTDFVEGDLAMMLMENYAFIGDTLSFKIDQIANEIFIDTVTEIANAFRLCQLVGFQPLPPIAAVSMWTATINNVLTADCTIPSGMEVSLSVGGTPLTVELFAADSEGNPIFDQDIIISAGSLVNANIIGLEGTTTNDAFTGNGTSAQSYQCTVGPVIYDSVSVMVDGIQWTEVDYFTDSNPRREYRVEYDSSYNAYIIFGNNRAGLIPSNGSQIVATYRTGGGSRGNIVTGAVSFQRTVNVAGFNYSVPVVFSNYTSGQYGYDGDGIDDIRRKLPAYLRTQNRCVTGLDYKTTADQFATPYQGQIGKSTAVLRNYGCAANIIDLYVLASDGQGGLAEASDNLKTSLQTQIDSLKMLTDVVCIRDGTIILADIAIDLTIDKFYRKFQDELNAKVTMRVNNFFSLNNWDYGQTLKETDLIKSLSDIPEIKTIDITFTTNDPSNSGQVVTSNFYEIIRPDTLTISFIYD